MLCLYFAQAPFHIRTRKYYSVIYIYIAHLCILSIFLFLYYSILYDTVLHLLLFFYFIHICLCSLLSCFNFPEGINTVPSYPIRSNLILSYPITFKFTVHSEFISIWTWLKMVMYKCVSCFVISPGCASFRAELKMPFKFLNLVWTENVRNSIKIWYSKKFT